jgi:hypothetical protein
MRGAVRQVAKPNPGKGKGLARATIEEDLLVSQVVHGRKSALDMSPKEVVLDNMHHFQNAAYTSEVMIQVMLRKEKSDERDKQITALELDVERLRRIASDEAYKVMPFIHARKMPTMGAGGESLGDNMVRLMLDEIDRLNREHPLVIEHIPQKRTA